MIARAEAARSARRGSDSPRARPARPPARRGRGPAGGRRRSDPRGQPTPARRAHRSAPPRPPAARRRPRSADARPCPRAPAARSPSRRRGVARARAGSRQATFRWTGPGRGLPACRGVGAAGDRAEVEQAGVVGLVGADVAEPAHRRPPYSFSWSTVCPAPIPRSPAGRSAVSTISGTPASSRLAHRRMQVGRGGAGGAENGRGAARSPARRRVRSTPRPARPRAPRPRSRAVATGQGRAGWTGSPGPAPPGEGRSAPAPRPAPTPARYCDWWHPPSPTVPAHRTGCSVKPA